MSVHPETLAAQATRPEGRTVPITSSADVASLGPLDTAVLSVDDDLAGLAALLDAAPDGARVVALLPWRVAALPVARLVDVLARHRAQAAALVPVADRGNPTALVVELGDSGTSLGHLASRGVVELDADQRRRRRAELVLGGAVDRARSQAEHGEREALRRRAVAAEADVARLTAEAAALRASRSYEVGQAFAQVRTAPVSGIVRLPGRLRRAGKGSAGR